MKIGILFEDQTTLVVCKPTGLVVNRSQSAKGLTLQDWIEKKYPGGALVHRLDKETSGVLLIAKNDEALAFLQRQFKKRETKKTYLTLVHGQILPRQAVIKTAISRSPFDSKKFGVFLSGRPAETKYELVRYYQNKKGQVFSLLKVFPKTGRTHQIRVHLKFQGYSVVGDSQYAGRKTARADRQWCPRQFLHAKSLTFTHPQTKKVMTCQCPLALDLKSALASLTALA